MKVAFKISLLLILFSSNSFAQDTIAVKPRKNVWGISSGLNYKFNDEPHYNSVSYKQSEFYPSVEIILEHRKKWYNQFGIDRVNFYRETYNQYLTSYNGSMYNSPVEKIKWSFGLLYNSRLAVNKWQFRKLIPTIGVSNSLYFQYDATNPKISNSFPTTNKITSLSNNLIFGFQKNGNNTFFFTAITGVELLSFAVNRSHQENPGLPLKNRTITTYDFENKLRFHFFQIAATYKFNKK